MSNIEAELEKLTKAGTWMNDNLVYLVFALLRIALGTPKPKNVARNALEDAGFTYEWPDE